MFDDPPGPCLAQQACCGAGRPDGTAWGVYPDFTVGAMHGAGSQYPDFTVGAMLHSVVRDLRPDPGSPAVTDGPPLIHWGPGLRGIAEHLASPARSQRPALPAGNGLLGTWHQRGSGQNRVRSGSFDRLHRSRDSCVQEWAINQSRSRHR